MRPRAHTHDYRLRIRRDAPHVHVRILSVHVDCRACAVRCPLSEPSRSLAGLRSVALSRPSDRGPGGLPHHTAHAIVSVFETAERHACESTPRQVMANTVATSLRFDARRLCVRAVCARVLKKRPPSPSLRYRKARPSSDQCQLHSLEMACALRSRAFAAPLEMTLLPDPRRTMWHHVLRRPL